jgi:hypothetical protein
MDPGSSQTKYHTKWVASRVPAANNPVIVFQNLTLRWASQWHYALVVGYNLTEKKIILHSGHQPYMKVDISDFEYTWKLADNWGLVVLAPDKLSASATEMAKQFGRLDRRYK